MLAPHRSPFDPCPIRLDTVDGHPVEAVLWLPFIPQRHPQTDAIQARNLTWLHDHGLLTPQNARAFRRAQFHDLAGRVYHHLDEEALLLVADFIAALFVLDDWMDASQEALCRDPRLARRAMDTLRQAAHTGHAPPMVGGTLGALSLALAHLTVRLQQRKAPLDSYLAEMDAYLDGVVEETRRRTSRFSGIEDYASVRVAFSAVYACIALGLALDGRLPLARHRPLARAANLSVSWVNDLFSWPKERALAETSNLIPILQHQQGGSEARAFFSACHACDAVVADYLEQRDHLSDPNDPEVTLLEAWMRGNYDWHALGTARYSAHLSVLSPPPPVPPSPTAPRHGGAGQPAR